MIRSLLFVLALIMAAPIAAAQTTRQISGEVVLLERIALPFGTSFMVDLVDADDTKAAESRAEIGDTQSPFAFALDAPTDRALILRAGLRAPGGQFWLTEPYALNPGTDDITLPPLRAIATPPMGFASLLDCGGQYVEIGFLPEELRLRFNEQVLTLVPRPAASGAYYEQADNPATSAHLKAGSAILTIDGAQLADCRFIAASEELARGVWNLTQIDGNAALFPSRTELVFFSDGRMSATVGCNRLIGGFQRHGGILTFGRIASTMMACTDATMAQEQRFARALERVDGYRLSPETGRLSLTAQGAVVIDARRQ
ncbi:MAG: putative lipoprotein [Roseibaca calidilacus]|uniref:Heat shock protein HslJ n=1 Tax=Roseibaca calidilacus TaxID=1666912 RepID=A0A0P7VSP6_9RHOB|nr:META domain-containing protein [Roseibaca calidilacus]KPP89926.1 MAG: putative lipoprotein [Roseibaca calidilacus]CUX81014.1 Heat shock protein HslJ [Roseibaca calidilacus]